MRGRGENGARMGKAAVLSQTGWPTSSSSKGTLSFDFCGRPCRLSRGSEGDRQRRPCPVAVGTEESSKQHPARARPSPSLFYEWGVRVPLTQVAQEHSVLRSCPCRVLPDDVKSPQSSRVEPTLRLLCVLMTARQCLHRALPSHPQDKKRSS